MSSPKRSVSFSLGATAVGVLALVLFGGAALAATRNVEVGQGGGLNFVDAVSHTSTSNINVGDTVMWTWDGGFHSTTSGTCSGGCSRDGIWDSGEQGTPFSFSQTFNAAGTFPYYCTVHGASMTGTVVVSQAGTPPVANFTFSPSAPVMGATVSFTDTSSGAPTSWSWNFGDPASGSSNTATVQNPTHVFQAADTYTVSLTAANASGSNTATRPVTVSAGGGVPCAQNDQTLCLNGGRFEVTADWTKADSSSGRGTGVKLTDDSGYFWFFANTNVELVAKVLNACSFADAYWVFSAGLTDVGVSLTARDTQTGVVYSYVNPTGTVYVTQAATSAFPTSCP